MATNRYAATGLTGGTDGDLDKIDGSILNDGDTCVVTETDTVYEYRLSASSGAAESSPDVISPDTNAGTKRWILQRSTSSYITSRNAYGGKCFETDDRGINIYDSSGDDPAIDFLSDAGAIQGQLQWNDKDFSIVDDAADNMIVANNNAAVELYHNGTKAMETNSEGISVSLSGINFPDAWSKSADANTMDDYEEGTWTPLAADAQIAGNSVTSGSGRYTKIGDLVFITGLISNIDTTGLTAINTLWIQDLPFPAYDGYGFVGSIWTDSVTISGNYLTFELPSNSPSARIKETTTAAGDSEVVISDLVDDTSDINFSLVYQTDTA